jgi:glycosyltransferase involved in cell wall biosynthesis
MQTKKNSNLNYGSEITIQPLITTIIPTYQRPQMLKRAIQSVLNQTFPAFQICVYDNASNDDTQKVVAELAKTDSRISYYCHEENIGALKNWNFGLKEVNTPFFLWLSDDDLLLPHFFEQAVQSLVSNPDVMFYAGLTVIVEDNKVANIAKEHGRFGYFPPPEGALEILSTGGLISPSIVFRSEVRAGVGILDEETGYSLDTDFYLRIAAHHPIIISNEPSGIHTQHEGSFSATFSDVRLLVPGLQTMSNKVMSDESLPLDVRINIQDLIVNEWICWSLRVIGERASVRGESDNVRAAAELIKRICKKKSAATVLLSLSKVRESSEPAYRLVNLIRGLFIFCASFNDVLANKKRSRQLQEQYGKYLHYLNDYT